MPDAKVPFPIYGLASGTPASGQPLRTSFQLQNVRPYDVSDERMRGGQRPGTALAYTTQITGDYAVLYMTSITTTYIVPEA